jgi:hypothetical protein
MREQIEDGPLDGERLFETPLGGVAAVAAGLAGITHERDDRSWAWAPSHGIMCVAGTRT